MGATVPDSGFFGKIQETRIFLMENGCRGWDRTSDQVINSYFLALVSDSIVPRSPYFGLPGLGINEETSFR